MKKHLQRTTLGVLSFGLALSIVLPSLTPAVASAATAATSTKNTTNTLKISPVRSDTTIEAGKSGKITAQVTNVTNAPMIVHPIQNDFVAGDEKGTPAIILDENSYAPTHSLKRFMVPIQDISIPAGQTKEVVVTITVPKNAQAGGYFGAIRFAPASSDSSKSVNLSASAASLILMTVPGPTTEKLKLTNFDVQQDGSTGSNFRTPNDLKLLLRFQNQGNIQQAPFGQIYVQKGKKVVYTYNFNQSDPKETILPDSARRWELPLKNIGKFGKYTVSGTITYGSKGQSINLTKTIWIVPTGYIIGAIVGIVALIAIIVGIWLFLRSYKRRILKKSRSYRR